MAKTVELAIKVVTDTRNAATGLDSASGKFGKFQAGVQKLAIPAAIAGAAILKFGSDAVEAASKTQQAMGAIDSVFGKSAGQVKKWSDQAAESVGLSKSQYGEMATVLGAQLKNMGVPMGELAGKTNDLIKKGADLSAMFGGTSAEAVQALGSALRGETDPIERYGISIKQADIAARMAADGTDKLQGKQAKAAKTAALLALVNEQSADAVGTFAEESDSAAGSAQISAAKFENMKSALGTALLPVVAAVTTKLGELAGWMQKNQKATQIIIGVIAALSAGILILVAALKVYEITLKVIAIVQKATWLSNPIFLVIAAVIALIAVFVILYKKNKTFKAFVDRMWASIKQGARAAAQVFKAVWNVAVSVVKGYVKAWVAYFRLVFGVIKGLVKLVIAIFKGDWRGALDAVKGILGSFRDFFRNIFGAGGALGGIVDSLKDKIKTAMGNAIDWLKDKLSGVGDALSKPFDVMKNAIDNVIDAVESLISWISKIKIPDVSGLISKIPGVGKSAAAAPTVSGASVDRFAAPLGPSARVGVAGRSQSAPGPTIVVNGALDPEAVARQIRRILDGHDRRVGVSA